MVWNCNLTEPVNRIEHVARGKDISNVEDTSDNRNLQFVNQTTPSQYSWLQWSLTTPEKLWLLAVYRQQHIPRRQTEQEGGDHSFTKSQQ